MNTVTRTGLDDMLRDSITAVLETSGVLSAVERLNRGVVAQDDSYEARQNVPMSLHMHQGRLLRLPPDFDWPECSTNVLYQFWHCGNLAKGHLPFKTVKPYDLAKDAVKKASLRCSLPDECY